MCAFETAFAKGLRWAEFDVQLTRDMVPVLFHDVTMALALPEEQTPLKIAVKEIELKQLPRLAFRPPLLPVPKRAASEVRLPTHVARRGAPERYTVHGEFPTLEQVFRRTPDGMCFNVELKYAEWKAEEGYFVDRGAYLGAVLGVVSAHAGARELVFSSFDPDLCWMIKQKQAHYPVLFLTEGGQATTEDPRKDTLEAALEWAVFAGLDGVVADAASVLPQRPETVAAARSRGLLFFTYGGLNNDPVFVKQQRDLGVDAIITDRWQVQEGLK
jgi:glycerophosphoryl diester phosphodiesterase